MLPDPPLSPEARHFLDRIGPRIRVGLDECSKIPVGVLVWGPGMSSAHPLAAVRLALRARLRQKGHLAMYSEELCDPASPHSLRVQQFVQAQNFDLVVSLPGTAGAIAEVHDFASHPRVSAKMLVFVSKEHIGGYGEDSLRALSTVLTAQVEYYPDDSDTGRIEEVTMAQVQRIQELKFMYGWRMEA